MYDKGLFIPVYILVFCVVGLQFLRSYIKWSIAVQNKLAKMSRVATSTYQTKNKKGLKTSRRFVELFLILHFVMAGFVCH